MSGNQGKNVGKPGQPGWQPTDKSKQAGKTPPAAAASGVLPSTETEAQRQDSLRSILRSAGWSRVSEEDIGEASSSIEYWESPEGTNPIHPDSLIMIPLNENHSSYEKFMQDAETKARGSALQEAYWRTILAKENTTQTSTTSSRQETEDAFTADLTAHSTEPVNIVGLEVSTGSLAGTVTPERREQFLKDFRTALASVTSDTEKQPETFPPLIGNTVQINEGWMRYSGRVGTVKGYYPATRTYLMILDDETRCIFPLHALTVLD